MPVTALVLVLGLSTLLTLAVVIGDAKARERALRSARRDRSGLEERHLLRPRRRCDCPTCAHLRQPLHDEDES